jgi:hypothetical protein
MKTLNDITCILNWIELNGFHIQMKKNEIQIGGESTENFFKKKKNFKKT